MQNVSLYICTCFPVPLNFQDPALPWDTGVVLWVDAGNYLTAGSIMRTSRCQWERWDSDIQWFRVVIQPTGIIRYDVFYTICIILHYQSMCRVIFLYHVFWGKLYYRHHMATMVAVTNNPTTALRHADPRPILHEALEVACRGVGIDVRHKGNDPFPVLVPMAKALQDPFVFRLFELRNVHESILKLRAMVGVWVIFNWEDGSRSLTSWHWDWSNAWNLIGPASWPCKRCVLE